MPMKRLISTLREMQIVNYAIALMERKPLLVEPKQTVSAVFPIVFVKRKSAVTENSTS